MGLRIGSRASLFSFFLERRLLGKVQSYVAPPVKSLGKLRLYSNPTAARTQYKLTLPWHAPCTYSPYHPRTQYIPMILTESAFGFFSSQPTLIFTVNGQLSWDVIP